MAYAVGLLLNVGCITQRNAESALCVVVAAIHNKIPDQLQLDRVNP